MKVVVLAGGISTERDVSLISGKMIYQAMKSRLLHAVFLRLTNPAIHTFCTYKQYGSYDPEQT